MQKYLLFINAFSPLLGGVGQVPKVTHFTIGVFPAQPRAARGGGEKRVSTHRGYLHIYISTYLHIYTSAHRPHWQWCNPQLSSHHLLCPAHCHHAHCWLFIAQIWFPHLFRGRIVESLVWRRKWRHGWGNEERASSITPQLKSATYVAFKIYWNLFTTEFLCGRFCTSLWLFHTYSYYVTEEAAREKLKSYS